MTNIKPSKSAMHQRFAAVTTEVTTRPAEPSTTWFEPALLEILLRPVAPGMAREEHTRKEHEIGSLFMRLTVLEAWTLHKRLGNPQPDDAIAVAFGRLIVERRGRLLAFLGDARRRAAIARAA